MSAPNTIHHINILVSDLDKQSAVFSELLNTQPIIEQLSEREVITARFRLGTTWLVLVSPVNNQSEVAKILLTKGEGVFLISLGVNDLDLAITQLLQSPKRFQPKARRVGLDGWKVQDIELMHDLGFVLQLTEDK